MDLKETEILGDGIADHWYYSSKAKMLEQVIGPISKNKILDIGAGSAFFSKHLLKNTSAQECMCLDISYPENTEGTAYGKPIHFYRDTVPYSADLVLLMDVLEHIPDDVAFLKSHVDPLPSGTHFLITVPAFQFLWSSHDVFLEHQRRYTLKRLEKVVLECGLIPQKQFYFYGLVFPLALITRLADKFSSQDQVPRSKLVKHHPIINWLLKKICSLELHLMGMNQVAGLSVVCLAKKP
ncbi:bifunctional 2-polyprenyl-6-hydroxyphenol methylase/3-demethylubiquinol 3-O-methyltransferase UbiG [Polynucleobacter sp. UB-Tiil-W10]|uniref:class I SAM-dependent methyltransferase n=1 Tax=Polynucleobacter sp. UB-Tiil-W10 TaxID=1855648 RepID=UPI001C0B8E5D|nr:class I SAM-dependent methyltransferase [Polynucleobacter sp. UB-Tiil-W10]MBU3539660.1 methyltransferase [Polynucleobacter sp. UB-Tiil-W10]